MGIVTITGAAKLTSFATRRNGLKT